MLRKDFSEGELDPFDISYTQTFLKKFNKLMLEERDPIISAVAALAHHRRPELCAEKHYEEKHESYCVAEVSIFDIIYTVSDITNNILLCDIIRGSVHRPFSIPIGSKSLRSGRFRTTPGIYKYERPKKLPKNNILEIDGNPIRPKRWFSGDWSGKDLSGLDMRRCKFTGMNLSDTNLTNANLSRADVTDCIFHGAIFTNTNLTGAELAANDFSGAIMNGVFFPYNCQNSVFRETHLEGAFMDGSAFTGSDFTKAHMVRADLFDTYLRRANLYKANLNGARMNIADCTNADLRGADLRNTDCTKAIFKGADLRNAKLSGAIFKDADFTGAKHSKNFDPASVV